MPHLSTLYLSCCLSLNAAGLSCVAISCPVLSSLFLAKCKQLSDADLMDAFKHFK